MTGSQCHIILRKKLMVKVQRKQKVYEKKEEIIAE